MQHLNGLSIALVHLWIICVYSTDVANSTVGTDSIYTNESPVRVYELDAKKKTHNITSSGVNVYFKNLNVSDIYDVYRIVISIRKPTRKSIANATHYLQVTSSNGRDSISFSVPDTTSNGTLIFEAGRILNPLHRDDLLARSHLKKRVPVDQILTITVKSRLDTEITYDLWQTHIDKAQYYVDIKPSSSFSLMNQKVNYIRPQAYRINATDSEVQVLHLTIRSPEQLCAVLVISNSERSIYSISDGVAMESTGIRKISFTDRLDLMLRKEEVKMILYMYVLAQSDDSLCDPNTEYRVVQKAKQFNITWTAEPEMNYVLPVLSFMAVFLVLPVFVISKAAFSIYKDAVIRQHHLSIDDHDPHNETGVDIDAPNEQPTPVPIEQERTPSPADLMLFNSPPRKIIRSSDDADVDVEVGMDTDVDHHHQDRLVNLEDGSPSFISRRDDSITTGETPNTPNSTVPYPRSGSDSASPVSVSLVSREVSCSTSHLNEIRHPGLEWSWADVQFVFYLIPALLQSGVSYYGTNVTDHPDDVCFHNYACARPLGSLISFNHMVSNVGYFINACIYLVFVRMRRSKSSTDLGMFPNYGIELCMGFGLLCESAASAFYHLCPSQSAYHFDTPFIQVVCVLIMMKLYGNRHGVITSRSAHLTISAVLGGDVAIGMFDHHHVLRIVLISCHLLAVVLVLSKVTLGEDISKKTLKAAPVLVLRRAIHSLRNSLFGILTLLANVLISVGFFLNLRYIQTNQVVTLICIVNVSLYMVYYFTSKRRSSEATSACSNACGIVAIVFWSAALYCFLSEETNWALTPAQSRSLNSDCVLLSFYDLHDLWHLFSALAILLTFISVSTVDDPQVSFPRRELAVF